MGNLRNLCQEALAANPVLSRDCRPQVELLQVHHTPTNRMPNPRRKSLGSDSDGKHELMSSCMLLHHSGKLITPHAWRQVEAGKGIMTSDTALLLNMEFAGARTYVHIFIYDIMIFVSFQLLFSCFIFRS